MFIHVDFPSHAVLSVCTEGSGLVSNCMAQSMGLSCLQGVPQSMIMKRRNMKKTAKGWAMETSFFCTSVNFLFFPLVPHHFSIMFWTQGKRNTNHHVGRKKNLIITASNEKMDTSEKCKGIVIFHILIHITRTRKETPAVYQIGLVPFALGHAAHRDISFKYRLLAIREQKSPRLPHRPTVECLMLSTCQDSFNQKAQINVVLWALSTVNCYWSQQMKFVHADRSNTLSVFSTLLPESGNSGGINK